MKTTSPTPHPIQARILRDLLFRTGAGFAELNAAKHPTDQFTFHLKQLVRGGLIEKDGRAYRLSTAGKEFANRLDTDEVVIEKQAKICVVVAAVKRERGVTKYLSQQRLKQPYFGFHGFVTGKVRWGETFEQAAARELEEETGLTGTITFMGVRHKMDYAPDGKLLEDKCFFVYKATGCRGVLVERFEGGANTWRTAAELLALPDLFDGVAERLRMIAQPSAHPRFAERKYTVSGY